LPAELDHSFTTNVFAAIFSWEEMRHVAPGESKRRGGEDGTIDGPMALLLSAEKFNATLLCSGF
jgi:hypothetical protein